jgi:hypothetical protein
MMKAVLTIVLTCLALPAAAHEAHEDMTPEEKRDLDRIAIDFPELTLIGIHLGYPWTEEMISVAWKHPNVFVGTDAQAPRYWDPSLVRFINGRGQDKVLFDSRTQYQSFVLPFLFAAAIGGYDRLALRRPGPWPKIVLVVAMFTSLALASRTINYLSADRFWPRVEHRQAWEMLTRVPDGAAVSAWDRYVAHVSLRPLVFVFPVGIEKADHVLLYAPSFPSRANPEVTLKREDDTVAITIGEGGPTYRYDVVFERGPSLLLRRR